MQRARRQRSNGAHGGRRARVDNERDTGSMTEMTQDRRNRKRDEGKKERRGKVERENTEQCAGEDDGRYTERM